MTEIIDIIQEDLIQQILYRPRLHSRQILKTFVVIDFPDLTFSGIKKDFNFTILARDSKIRENFFPRKFLSLRYDLYLYSRKGKFLRLKILQNYNLFVHLFLTVRLPKSLVRKRNILVRSIRSTPFSMKLLVGYRCISVCEYFNILGDIFKDKFVRLF